MTELKSGSKDDAKGFLEKHALPLLTALGFILFFVHILFAFVQVSYYFPDDIIYVQSAIHLVLGQKCPPVGGNVCNYEHPPLSKLLTALGFYIFGRTEIIGQYPGLGINQLGGRIFPALMNFLAVPVLYLVVRRISGNWKMAFIAAVLLLIDPLYFTLSSTTLLDVPMVFFALLALLPYAYSANIGMTKAALATGAIFGLSLLSKESAVFILFAVLSFEILFGLGAFRMRLKASALILISATSVFIVGLQIFDSVYTLFPNFFSQLEVILPFQAGLGPEQVSYLKSITVCGQFQGLCPTNFSLVPHILYSHLPWSSIYSTNCSACFDSTNPIDWITYFPPVVFQTDVVLAPNYPMVWLSIAWVPLAVVRWRSFRVNPEGRAALLASLLFLWNLGSNLAVYSALHRPVFEWYFLPAVPALAIGASYVLTRKGIPKWLAYSIFALIIVIGLFLSSITHLLLFPEAPPVNFS